MIKRLRVKNYKSLKDVDLELGLRNVLVGPNMAGKSNLIDCLRFLTDICNTGVATAFLNRGGFPEVFWKGEDEGSISLYLHIELPADEQEPERSYEYEIAIIGSRTGLISVAREHLEVISEGRVSTLIDLINGHGHVTHTDGSKAFDSPDPGKSALEFSVPGWEGMVFKNYMAEGRYYRLEPAVMKQANVAIGQPFLMENGQNFSSWLMTLQTAYPDEFRLIKQVAKDVFPDLEELLAPPTQVATTHLITRERHLKRPVTIWHMSDGEIVFLAWLSLIFAPLDYGASLICIEEVENHLHPKMLDTLIEVLTQQQYGLGVNVAQIFVTTHSLYLVDKMNLEDLIVVERVDGATRCTRPVSKAHLKELIEREEIGLGQLLYSGALGGD